MLPDEENAPEISAHPNTRNSAASSDSEPSLKLRLRHGKRMRIQVNHQKLFGHVKLIGKRGQVIRVESGGTAQIPGSIRFSAANRSQLRSRRAL